MLPANAPFRQAKLRSGATEVHAFAADTDGIDGSRDVN
jgi:glycerate-2-kinase